MPKSLHTPTRSAEKPKKKAPGKVDLKEDLVHGEHVVEFSWPLVPTETECCAKAAVFSMCGLPWSVTLRVNDVDGVEMLSVHLASYSDEQIRASYSLTLLSSVGRSEDIYWTDPEGVIEFSSRSEGNNEWGAEDFTTVDHVNDPSTGLLSSQSRVSVRVEVNVQGRLDFNSHESLSAAIEHATKESDLLNLANEDLQEIVSKLPVRKNINAQTRQEDKIIHQRTHTSYK